jgi:hypothetical protein
MSFFMLLPISLLTEGAPLLPGNLAALVGSGFKVTGYESH